MQDKDDDTSYAAQVGHKVSKASANYTDHARVMTERCALCEYILPHDHKYTMCQKVRGQIERGGWCKLFERDED